MASLSIDVSVNSAAAIRELRELNNNLNAIRSTEQNLNTTSNTTFNNMNNGATKVNGSVKLLGATFNGFKSVLTGILGANLLRRFASGVSSIFSTATENASTLYEYSNVLEQIFKKQANLANEWIKLNSKNYGLSIVTSTKYLSEYAALLDTIGVKNKEVLLDMSQNYTKLAGDIASFFNISSEAAFTALTSGITGTSVRPLLQYGLVLKSTNLEQYLATKGIDATWKSLTELEKEYVRYAYILDSTRNIQGDYARTSDSFANSLHTLQENWKNLLGVLGSYGITIITPVVQWLAVAIKYIEYFSKKLFELFGIEPTEYEFGKSVQDMSVNFGDSADSTDEILDNTIDTGKQILKNNKALKQGTKLLDLYYIDLPSSDEDSGINPPDIKPPEVDTDLYAKLKDSFWYNDFPLEDIKIDTTAVDRIIKFISDIKDNLTAFVDWLKYDLGLEDALDFIFANPADIIEDIGSLLFGTAMAALLFKNYILPFLVKVFALLKGSAAIQGIVAVGKVLANGLLLGIAAAIGGYNIGEAFADWLLTGEADIMDATIGIVGSIAAIIYGAATAGPIGAALAAIVVAITTVIGSIQQAKEQGVAAAKDTMSATSDMLESYQSVLDNLFDSTAYTESQSRLGKLKEDFVNTTDYLVNTEIPKLSAALRNESGLVDLNVFSDLTQAYKDLSEAAAEYKSETYKEELKTSFDMFATGADKIGLSRDAVTRYMEEYNKWHDQFIENLRTEYQALEIDAASGIDVNQDRLNALRDYFGTTKTDFDEFKESISTATNLNLFTPESIDNAKSQLESIAKTAESVYTSSLKNMEQDLSVAITDIDKQNIEEQIKTLKALYDGYVDFYNTEVEKFNTKIAESAANSVYFTFANIAIDEDGSFGKETILSDFMQGIADQVKSGSTADVEKAIEIYGNAIEWDKLPAKFKELFLAKFKDSGLSTEDKHALGSALYVTIGKWIESGLSSSATLENGTLSFNLDQIINSVDLGLGNKIKLEESLRTLATDLGSNEAFDAVYDASDTTFSVSIASVKPLVKPENVDTSEVKKIVNGQTQSAVSTALSIVDVKQDATNKGTDIGDDISDGITDELDSPDTTKELTDAATEMLSGISSESDAQAKGTAFGKSIISGLSTVLRNVDSDTEYVDAKTKFINSLISIPDKFLTAFKATLKSIGSEIETFGVALGNGLDSTFTSDLTVTQLATKLKSGGLKVPYLANGAVIPPNNPFLAVLGDQRSGTNIEAPVEVIREAVEDAAQPNVTVENRVYIGNREIQDFIVDTVIDSNLVTG